VKILAIDTSTKSGSVAITEDDCILAETLLNIDATHSETLLPSLKDILVETGIGMEEIDLFALTLGPGSFTGVRIGVSTVKGFAFALGRPVVGVSTLEALALNFPHSACTITPILDARRGEVYTARFRRDGGLLERLSEDSAMAPEKLLEEVGERTLFVGDGLQRYGGMIKERLGGLAEFAAPSENFIRASNVAMLCRKRFEEGDTLDPAVFTPRYLRKSEAEINRKKGLLKNC